MQHVAFVGLLVLATSMIVPGVASADAAVLKVTVVSAQEEVTIQPGGRAVVGLNVTVEFMDYPCQAGTKAGVDLVPPVAPPDWFGADPHPDGDTYASPKQTRPASLTIVVAEDAPGNANGVFRLQPVVHLPAPADCAGTEPQVDAPEFSIRVKTPPGSSSSAPADPSDDPPGDESPGPGLGSVLVLLGVGLWLLQRRRQ